MRDDILKGLKWPVNKVKLKEVLAPDTLAQLLAEGVLLEAGDYFYLLDGLNFTKGSFRVVREQFAFVENDEGSFYVAQEDFNQALDADEVLISIHEKDNRKYGKVLAVLKHTREYLLGTLEKKQGKIIFVPYDRKVLLPVYYRDPLQAKIGDRVIGKITSFGKEIHVEITSILGQKDEPGMDVLSVLYIYNLETDFNEESLAEAKAVAQELSLEDLIGRMDHRDQAVITVDGEDAKDLDDAIYMEALHQGYRLYVHIADVSHYVKRYTALDQEAYQRSSSIYMVDRVVPMLPKELSNGICSLHPYVDRLTLTCQIDFDFNAEMIDYHIYPSVIQSKRRFSYNEVNAARDLGEYQEMIEMMLDCAARLAYRRQQAGSIDFDTDESQFIVDDRGDILDVFRRERGEAEKMIESFMIAANEAVALQSCALELPILYRVHEKPDKEKLQELSHTLRILGYRMKGSLDHIHPKALQKALDYFKEKPEYPIVSRLVLRSMSKARYSEDALGHFGLALEDYTHFTSPIRRYPDLLLHQRLRTYLFANNYEISTEDEAFARSAADHVSAKERAILDAERQVEKMKKAEFMKKKIGEVYIGYISGVSNFGIFVELANTVEGMVALRSLRDDYYVFDAQNQSLLGERSGNIFKIGDKVKVKVSGVDDHEYIVEFELIRPRKGGKAREPRRQKS